MPTITSLIDEAISPPFATLNPVLDSNGPYATGNYNIDSFTTTGAFLLPAGTYDIGGTYGVLVRVATVAPAVGVRTGWADATGVASGGDEWQRRICQLVLLHWLPIPSLWIPTMVQDLNMFDTLVAWPVLLGSGSRLGLHVDPGWSVELFFMCVL